jgi:hypothetical protein
MIKIKVYDLEEDKIYFEGSMPSLPKKGECIGFWYENEWTIRPVAQLVYEFDEDNNFLLVEITIDL